VEVLADGGVDVGVEVIVVADRDDVIRVPALDLAGDVAERRAGGEVADDRDAGEQPPAFQQLAEHGATKRTSALPRAMAAA
jgi:hypothetical protein